MNKPYVHRTITCTFLVIFSCLLMASPLHAFTPGSVRVRVTDLYSQAPLSGAAVLMTPGSYSGTTDDNGTLIFSGITPYRNYAVTATIDGYVEGKYGDGRTGFIWVENTRETTVSIALRHATTISGQVSAGTEPMAEAMVVAIEERKDGPATIAAARTADNGTYTLVVPEGNYSLAAVADSYYKTQLDRTVGAGETLEQNFTLKPGSTRMSYTIKPSNTYYGSSVSLKPDNLLVDLLLQNYWLVLDLPPGAQLIKSGSSSYIPTLAGNYTFMMMVVDPKGVGRKVVQTITFENHPTEAYPAIIPGPSELPLLYDGQVYADSSGLAGVQTGETAYLRGWGRDYNLPSPEQYNAAAPMFDIYGNKNGDWNQSAFSFSWTLHDKTGTDLTSLLTDPAVRNPSFAIPDDALEGDTFTATLTVTGDDRLAGEPAEVTVFVAALAGRDSCAACHSDTDQSYSNTAHAAGAATCEDCHGPGSLHSDEDPETISTTHWPGMCGRCHDEFAQWQKSRHSDPLAFGHAEVSPALIRNCYKCHYTDGFIGAAASGNVEKFNYPFGTQAPVDTPNVSCDVCHDPHTQSTDNPTGIRTGSAGSVCGTCHEKKWQNATLRATAGEIENGYHWDDYSSYAENNPHLKDKACVTCHMATDNTDTDTLGIRTVGGHSLRMRDVGADGNPGTADDVLNIGVCRTCHGSLDTFDRKGFMTTIKSKLKTLGTLLMGTNHGYLPPFQPGKCATCHRGGTLPFSSETADEVLNKAYKNYSLLLHDRSFGIHNPGYIERLLDDSIAQVEHLDNLRLTAFTVQPGNQSVTVSWTTDYENGIDSFSLYRAESEHGQYRLLSGSETTAAGSAAVGTDYHYTDTGLANRTTYYYKLKDRDSEGKETMHGPLQAKPRLKYIFSKDE